MRDTTGMMLTDLRPNSLGWRLAVLPFRGARPSAAPRIALGLAEEVSAAMARFGLPRLIATATFWDGSGPVTNARTLCQRYHLDYIIDGTIYIDQGEIEVDISLVDVVLDFETIWRRRFAGKLNDLFSLQNRIAGQTIRQIDPELSHPAVQTRTPVRTGSAEAHQAVLTAIRGIFRMDRPAFMQARESLAHAISLDPDYGAAHGWLAYWSIIAAGQGWVENPRAVMELAGTAATLAIQLDPNNARALAVAGHVRAYILHDVRGALELHERAIELNPDLPIAWTMSSFARSYNGEHATAIRHAMMARSLSPRDPHIWFTEHALTAARMWNRDLEEADILAESVLKRHPDHISAVNIRLAILGHLGRRAEAGRYLEMLLQFDPHVTVEKIAARAPLRPEDIGYYMEGLQRAGVPRA